MAGIFDFLLMAPYSERAVDRFEKDGLLVDTCAVNDSTKPYETAVMHPKYNNGKFVIVELYDTREEAQAGHKKWVETMTSPELPPALHDVSTCWTASLIQAINPDSMIAPYQGGIRE